MFKLKDTSFCLMLSSIAVGVASLDDVWGSLASQLARSVCLCSFRGSKCFEAANAFVDNCRSAKGQDEFCKEEIRKIVAGCRADEGEAKCNLAKCRESLEMISNEMMQNPAIAQEVEEKTQQAQQQQQQQQEQRPDPRIVTCHKPVPPQQDVQQQAANGEQRQEPQQEQSQAQHQQEEHL